MKLNLILVALLGLGLLGNAACGSDDDTPAGTIHYTWDLTTQGGTALNCSDENAVTFESSVQVGNTAVVDRFACSAFAGTTSSIPVGTWPTTISLLDANGNVIQSIDLSPDVDIVDDSTTQVTTDEATFVF